MFTIIGKSGCSYCVKAMETLNKMELKYQYTSVSEDTDLLNWVKEKGFTTVPQIWDGDIYIGGYVELENYLIDKL